MWWEERWLMVVGKITGMIWISVKCKFSSWVRMYRWKLLSSGERDKSVPPPHRFSVQACRSSSPSSTVLRGFSALDLPFPKCSENCITEFHMAPSKYNDHPYTACRTYSCTSVSSIWAASKQTPSMRPLAPEAWHRSGNGALWLVEGVISVAVTRTP